MSQGIIKKLMKTRGFGFLEDEDGREIFFHATELKGLQFGELEEGKMLEFNIEENQKGLNAKNVRNVE